ncbi:hypothetical protein D3C75_1129110 [compost metagenome]
MALAAVRRIANCESGVPAAVINGKPGTAAVRPIIFSPVTACGLARFNRAKLMQSMAAISACPSRIISNER